MASYALNRFKSDKDEPKLKKVTVIGGGAAFKRGAQRGDALGQANGFVRELQDAPGNRMRPRDLAAAARKGALPAHARR